MKKIFLITMLSAISMFAGVYAQQGMSYQAVIRDTQGAPVSNATMGVRVSILQVTADTIPAYIETHQPQSNSMGLISFVIGQGTAGPAMNFDEIDWGSGQYLLKTEVDPNGGENYSITGLTQFLSVPYTFVTKDVSYINPAPAPHRSILVFNSETGKYEPYPEGLLIAPKPMVIKPLIARRGQQLTVSFFGGSELVFSQASNACPHLYADAILRFDQGTSTLDIPSSGNYFTGPNRFDAIFDIPSNTPSGFYDIILGPSTPCEFTAGEMFKIFDVIQIITLPVSEITANSAIGGGDILSDGGSNITARGVVWSTSPNPTVENHEGITTDETGTGVFASNLTGLMPETNYFIRAYATNGHGIAYGEELSFTTMPLQPPTLSTAAVTSITQNSAISGGFISYDGGSEVTTRGVVWSTTPNPTVENHEGITTNGTGTGAFTSNLSNLMPETNYFIRAYATNSLGIAYGEELNFTTLPLMPPTLSTDDVTSITLNSAISGGFISDDGGSEVTARGVVWSTTSNPTVENHEGITTDGTGTGAFTSNLMYLMPGTTYYVRAYAINNNGNAYGNQCIFTTLGSIPIATTLAATDITITSAVLNGVVNPSNLSTTVVFQYGLTTEYGNTVTATQSPVDGSDDVSVSAFIDDLEPQTTYHFRVVAENELGTSYGEDMTFYTCGENITFTYKGQQVTYGTVSRGGLCWMDRNLGASRVPTSSTDSWGYGDLFQWGRLDDGHQNRTSGTTSTLSNTNVPGHGNFITVGTSPWDWRLPQNNNLWQGENGINNPCPPGWRVPTDAELNAERLSWGSNNSAGAYASTLKWPVGGYRDRWGTLDGVGSLSIVWSSSVSGTFARTLHFYSDNASMYSNYRALGSSVRCVMDETAPPPTYNLNLETSPTGAGTVTGAGHYEAGEQVNITATANEGWQFVNWTGDTQHLDDAGSAEAIVTMPADEVSLSANFETIPDAPTAITLAASDITITSAVLNGVVNPGNLSTTVVFQYGLTTEYGSTVTATQSPVDGGDDVSVSAFIDDLEPQTTYHFRVVAENQLGVTYGNQMSLNTLSQVIFRVNDESGNPVSDAKINIYSYTPTNKIIFSTPKDSQKFELANIKHADNRSESTQTIFYENFNTGILPDGWLNLDENGDGKSWFFVELPGHQPYDGDYAMASASWEAGTILFPDNWLITHLIENVNNDYVLSFQVKAQDPAWPAEKYDVLVSTTGNNPADFTSIHSQVLSSGEWQEVVLPLDGFAGEDIYIAFRHWDCSDWFQIVIDAIKLEGTSFEVLLFTNAVGYAYFDAHPGSYSYIVSKEGYHNYSGDFIVSDENVTISVVLNEDTEPAFYDLNIESSPSAAGSVTGAGEYHEGEEVSITAIPNQGWQFVNWTGDTQHLDDAGSAEAIVTMPAQNISLTAIFTESDETTNTVTFFVKNQQDTPISNARITIYPPGHTNKSLPVNTPLQLTPPSSVSGNANTGRPAVLEASNATKPGKAPSYQNDKGVGEWIKYWQSGINENSLGIGGGYTKWYAAIRWMPDDLTGYAEHAVSRIRVFMNDQPLDATAIIWQGTIEEPVIMHSQAMAVAEEDWVEVELTEPYPINTAQELWIGWGIGDQGDGVFPAAFEESNQYEGLANLLQFGDNPWHFASAYGFNVVWNIEAFVLEQPEPVIIYTDANGYASIVTTSGDYTYSVQKEGYSTESGDFTVEGEDLFIDVTLVGNFALTLSANPAHAGTVTGAGHYEAGEQVNITATANEGWEFVNWTGDTQHLDDAGSAEAVVTMPADNVTLTAVFQGEDPVFSCGDNITFIYKGQQVTYGTVSRGGLCWMDRNLGASRVPTSSTDSQGYGDLFQWGRLDDGHQNRTSGTTSTLSNTDVPGHGNFITVGSEPYDWRSPQNNNLWQGENGINNPCPPGWRVPTDAELNAERLSWGSNNSAGAYASTLKWPVGGYRDTDGPISSVGSYGSVWSSSVSGTTANSLDFLSGNALMGSYRRAYGSSVRCVKD